MAVERFLAYTEMQLTNHATQGIITYKRNNPQSTDIDLAVKAFSLENRKILQANMAIRVLGIFTTNFQLRYS